MTLEKSIHIPEKTYIPHGHNIKLDRNTLKRLLIEYNQNNEDGKFDQNYLRQIEETYNIRFVAANLPLKKNELKHDHLNVFAYAQNGKTETMHIDKATKSTTTLKFSKSLFDYIMPRLNVNPDTIEDNLTREAVKSLDTIVKLKTIQAHNYIKKL